MSGWMSAAKKRAVIEKTDGCCGYCGLTVSADEGTTDHIQPRSQGGGNSIGNLILSCRPCNLAKGNRSLDEFRLWIQWRDVCISHGFTVFQIGWLLDHTDLGERFSRPEVEFFFETKRARHECL